MTPERFVALLRGINVGGKNKLPMQDLAATFAAAGCASVRTYIQSGNVVFEAPRAIAKTLPDTIASQIAARFGYKTPVVLRSATELARVVVTNPFLKEAVDVEALHVLFLSSQPTPAQVKSLDPDRSPADAYVVQGREVFLYLPNGVARSKLTNAYFDARLGTTSTGRNWRTVTRLRELMEAPSA
jgi:uncharacterized protein (DUF1697 family)